MWARLALILGEWAGRIAVREAAKEIAQKVGMSATKRFFSEVSGEILKNATKKEIVDLATSSVKKEGTELLSKKIFSTSNARKLADIANKGTDVIEGQTRKYLEKKSLNLLNQRYVDILGKNGVDASGKVLIGKRRSALFTRARGFASDTLEGALFPQTRKQAFGVYYARGVIGEGTASTLNSLLLGTPRALLSAPKARAFVRAMTSEIQYLRTVGQVKNASSLAKALRTATGQARTLYGSQEPLVGSKIAGYVSGRLTVPLASTYVFVDGDQRKKNIDKFQSSIKPYISKNAKTWVDKYTRSDGTTVKGHYRQLSYA